MTDKQTSPRQPAPKSTMAEVERRVQEVAALLINGASRMDIVRFCAERWGIADRQAHNYYARARESVAEAAELHRQFEIGRANVRLNQLYRNAMKVQDLKTALQIIAELSRLYGLYAPTKTEHTGADGGAIEIRIVRDDDGGEIDERPDANSPNG